MPKAFKRKKDMSAPKGEVFERLQDSSSHFDMRDFAVCAGL
jgi:hypothetical protein